MDSLNVKNLFYQVVINSYCYFAPLSFIAIFINMQGNISPSKIALIMLVATITSRYSRMIFSPLFNIMPIYILLTLLQIFGAIGYLMLGNLTNPYFIFISLFLIGAFYGNSYTIIRVITIDLKSKKLASLNEKFALLHVATNVAAGTGPILLNFIYYKINPQWVFTSTAIVLFLASFFTFNAMRQITISKQNSFLPSIINLLLTKRLWPSYFLLAFAWFFYVQIFTLAPALLAKKYNLLTLLWSVAFINSTIVIAFSIISNKILVKINNDYTSISIGLILSTTGLLCLLFIQNYIGVLLGVAFISFAEIIFIPTFQAIHGKMVDSSCRVAIYTINALFVGIGEAVGYYFGITHGLGAGDINIHVNFILYGLLCVALIISIKCSRNNAYGL